MDGSKVVSVNVTLTGSFNCDLESTVQGEVSVSLFDLIIATSAPLPDTAMCLCANCGSRITVAHTLPHPEALSDARDLVVTAKQQPLCLSSAHVAVTVLLEFPTVFRPTPPLLASQGGTVVTLHGSMFLAGLTTWCNFVGAGAKVKATFLSAHAIQCIAPPYPFPVVVETNPVNVSLVVSYAPPGTVEIPAPPLTVFYFMEPKISGVHPEQVDKHSAGLTLTISGTAIIPSDNVRCKFQNGGRSNVTLGM